VKALFVRFRDGRSLPFTVSDSFSLDETRHPFVTGGGFLQLPDGRELWVNPSEIANAYLVPLVDGQRIQLAPPGHSVEYAPPMFPAPPEAAA